MTFDILANSFNQPLYWLRLYLKDIDIDIIDGKTTTHGKILYVARWFWLQFSVPISTFSVFSIFLLLSFQKMIPFHLFFAKSLRWKKKNCFRAVVHYFCSNIRSVRCRRLVYVLLFIIIFIILQIVGSVGPRSEFLLLNTADFVFWVRRSLERYSCMPVCIANLGVFHRRRIIHHGLKKSSFSFFGTLREKSWGSNWSQKN